MVVVADGNAVLLGLGSPLIELLGNLLGLLCVAERGHGAGHELHAELRKVGQVLAHHLEGHMGGDSLNASLSKSLLNVLGGYVLIVLGKLHSGVTHLTGALDFLNGAEIAVMTEGVEL